MHIPPWTILAGFGSLTRRELSDLLAVFEDTTLLNVVTGRIQDLADSVRSRERVEGNSAFRRQLAQKSDEVYRSCRSCAVVRLQLWHRTREAFDLEAAIPLATRTANLRAADVAHRAAAELRESITQGEGETSLSDLPSRIWSGVQEFFSSQSPTDFSEVVCAQASRMLAEAAQEGLLDDATTNALLERVRQQLEDAPPELRDRSVEHALKAGDVTALSVLTGGSSLAGIGIAVELAGFGAYILAAKASAILPLIGGKAAVSGLAVLANPFFIVPAILGGGVLANRHFRRSARVKLASALTTQMALKGLSAGRMGLAICLDDYRSLLGADVQAAGIGKALLHDRKIDLIRESIGGPLPKTPGRPPEALDRPPTGKTRDGLEQVLLPDRQGVASEALAVGTLTVADILYHAAAIDPEVLRAADFSRAEDLSGVFHFGVFADGVRGLGGDVLAGAENHLRGHVAEQLVATRLAEQGHQVELPDAPNNAGFDLIVDGTPCQVKCLADVDALVEHFDRYPDIPVYANAELADVIRESDHEWADKVSFVEGYDRGMTETIMQESLDAGAALNDPDIPMFAVAVSAARNVHAWWKGQVSVQDLQFEVAVDGALKGTLTAAGGFVGQSLGLLFFGPAGAVVFAAAGGTGALFGKDWARHQLDKVLVFRWIRGLNGPTENFRTSLKAAMRKKIRILLNKVDKVERLALNDRELAAWLRLRMYDNGIAIAEGLAEAELETIERAQPDRAGDLLRLMKEAGVHPWSVQAELGALARTLARKPTVGEVVRDRFEILTSMFSKVRRFRAG
ncbi:MAG: hypothetical protein F4029_20320 [Gammaproteobacteria bacterium]|nr:hypothetical protein [Gammaproteobacteria bacterium]MYF30111.1 hypothetical protein [Gammaproteobacteria bacterium]MYK48560.1 hypothetical protein [Gammaproteobacteria bacterium]